MKLTSEQILNAQMIVDALNNVGIDNRMMQIAIVCVCYKESGLIPRRENLNYKAERIKQCWPRIPDADCQRLAGNPEALGNYLYGGKYGNAVNEGFKYRGGGHNQITFKDIYNEFGLNPDTINNPKEAAKGAAKFFKKVLSTAYKLGKFKKFGVNTSLDVKDSDTAVKIAIQCNAGLGTSFENGLVQEGYKKSLAAYPEIANIL